MTDRNPGRPESVGGSDSRGSNARGDDVNESRTHLSSRLLQEYLESELEADRAAEVETHLAGCRRCASELDAWRTLFADLDEIPEVGPSIGFRERVMERVPTRSLPRRVLERLTSTASGRAREHLRPEGIQDLLDGALAKGARTRAHAHLAACGRCRDAFGAWEAVFRSLAEVPRLAPTEGFADRVLHAFEVSRASAAEKAVPAGTDWLSEWTGQLAALGSRLVPSTPGGWVWLAFIASLPTLGLAGLLGAVAAHPLLSVGGLATFLRWQAANGMDAIWSGLMEWTLQVPALPWLLEAATVLLASPSLALALFAATWMTAVAAGWVLYRNMIATPYLADPNA